MKSRVFVAVHRFPLDLLRPARIVMFLAATIVAAISGSPMAANAAGSCKPDGEWVDRISKQRNVRWEHNLTQMGFWKSMVATDVDLWVIVMRYGSLNVINIQVTAVENNRDRAALDSRLRAAKGDRFVFGVKDSSPLTFTATEVNNQSKIEEAKGLVMTTILSAHIPDSEMAAARDVLTKHPIDGIRLLLASGPIERGVDDKNGLAMMAKFSCFYQYLDSKKISLATTPAAVADSQESTPGPDRPFSAGRFVSKRSPADYVDFSADGTFFAQRGKAGFAGTYRVQGEVVTMVLPTGQATRSRFKGGLLTDSDGLVWEQEVKSPQANGGSLTVAQIIQLVKAKIGDDVVVATIKSSRLKSEPTPDELIALKAAGASSEVMSAIVGRGAGAPGRQPAASPSPEMKDSKPAEAAPSRLETMLPFKAGELLPVDLGDAPLAINGVELRGLPSLDKLRKAQSKSDVVSITARFYYSNPDDRDWLCVYRVSILDDSGQEIGSGERQATLDKKQSSDTNDVRVTVQAAAFERATKIRIALQQRRK